MSIKKKQFFAICTVDSVPIKPVMIGKEIWVSPELF